MMKKLGIHKYKAVAKDFADSHSVGDAVRSADSFMEGFNQAVQWMQPDEDLVLCPFCNSEAVQANNIWTADADLPCTQYPTSVMAGFKCLICKSEFIKKLKLSVV